MNVIGRVCPDVSLLPPPLPHPVTEKDVMDVEKTYWALKGSGKFDLESFQLYACPPIPQELCEGTHMHMYMYVYTCRGCLN